MKKILLIVTISILLILDSGFSGNSFGQEVADKITTIHIVTPAWENQTHKDGTGLFFEIIRKVYEPVGIKMEFEIAPWKRAKMMIDSKNADARLVVFQTRKDQLVPRYPVYVDYTALVCRKDSISTWEGIKSLEGHSVIWMRGYDNHKLPILQDMKYEWFEVNSYEQAWKMLEAGRVDCYMEAFIDLKPYVEQHDVDLSAYYVSEDVYSANAYLEFAKTDRSKELIMIYDDRMPKLLASGELQQLFEKWDVRFVHFSPKEE